MKYNALTRIGIAFLLAATMASAWAAARASAPAGTPDEAFAAYVDAELTSRPFAGTCVDATLGRDAGKYCRGAVAERDGMWAYEVTIVQADGGFWVFIAQIGDAWVVVALQGAPVEGPEGVPWPWPQTEPVSASDALTNLAAVMPSDVSSFSMRVFSIAGGIYAWLSYARDEPLRRVFPPDSLGVDTRRYDTIYRWNGEGWQVVLDAYALASSTFGADSIGALVEEKPAEDTALVTMRVTPLPRRDGDRGTMPDVVALELGYREGPTGLPHYSPTVVIGIPTPEGFTIAYQTQFEVRARLDFVARLNDSVLLGAPAYGPSDPRCCPRGSEFVRLIWQDGIFVQTERCVRSVPRASSCN